ncbi:GCG_CRPN prefix-to-repeats domain-containing protein [Rhodopseudomonas sp.]|uniref:GCG_CRPN prefix-to-repeats domain-containing protein n=1 Tax=Rhodopseudomonas sp. TaxID=1078 RepID=UPI003B3BE436
MIAAVLMSMASLWAGSAIAMPFGSSSHAPDLVRADWQCGRGWHVTSWGICRPDRRLGYRYSSSPYRYDDGYSAYGWTADHDWPHHHDGHHDHDWHHDHEWSDEH